MFENDKDVVLDPLEKFDLCNKFKFIEGQDDLWDVKQAVIDIYLREDSSILPTVVDKMVIDGHRYIHGFSYPDYPNVVHKRISANIPTIKAKQLVEKIVNEDFLKFDLSERERYGLLNLINSYTYIEDL